MKNKQKRVFSILLLITLLFSIVACSNNSNSAAEQPENVNKPRVSVAVLKGPTGIGAVQLLLIYQMITHLKFFLHQMKLWQN